MATMESHDNHLYGRGMNLIIICITLNVIGGMLLSSRLVARLKIGRLLMSDWVMLTSYIFVVGVTVANSVAVSHGYGKLAATLSKADLQHTLQAFWASQTLYKFTINLTKTSIILLYLQIFTARKFRLCAWIVIVYILSYAFASIIVTIFNCTPIARYWDKSIPGHCVQRIPVWYSNAVHNMLGDIITLVLPMYPTWQLKVATRQKIALMAVFALGFFVCVTSILRWTTLTKGAHSNDQSYGTLSPTIWTAIEANTAIICGCLPMLKGPLTVCCPYALSSFSRRGGAGGSGALETPRSALTESMGSPRKKRYGRLGGEGDGDAVELKGRDGSETGSGCDGTGEVGVTREEEGRYSVGKGWDDVELGGARGPNAPKAAVVKAEENLGVTVGGPPYRGGGGV